MKQATLGNAGSFGFKLCFGIMTFGIAAGAKTLGELCPGESLTHDIEVRTRPIGNR